ncbi:BZIP transcription factor [Colletotrichum higginsianum IMI 349063]|uniref:BZIP transcription factor n=1 Tax=Colletotrichum higginsianum (strain IMI 349063) TaxID=759273 RepID=A0A1B7XUS5_COLHI|nr:BZIP transcription factor [Colletotrichum higginsianum IMI 349063]OBR03515.1 BZIP transcription factor [Colletotrichum higginsianum IMI 349063]
MASNAVDHPSPAGSVASSMTPGLNHNKKRSAPHQQLSPPGSGNTDSHTPAGAGAGASPTSQPPDDTNKKRRAGPGSRGVANLTPEQLAKKRANDREAQRAIRERTKNQIEALERRIQELTSQQPYQDLQAVQRAKEAVEAENADLKRRLATFIASIQPLISSSPPAHRESSRLASPSARHPPNRSTAPVESHPVFPSPSGSYSQVHQPNGGGGVCANNVSTPNSAASPASIDPTAGWQATPGSVVPDLSSPNHMFAASKMLNQQRQDLRHGLDLGPEKLGLDFLLDQNAHIGKIQSGVNGAQDSPNYHHVPMKHDWTGVGSVQHSRSPSLSGPTVHTPRSQVDYPSSAPPEPRALASYSAEVKNCGPTCPLDSLLLDFLHERRQRAADGLSTQEIIGPRYPSVLSLLNPANNKYSHPLSKVFTDILATFPDLSALPQRVAVLYIMFLIMRWQISPTQANYDRLPEWARPRPSQLFTEHPAWVDHVPFPAMREKLCRDYNPRDYLFDNFFVPFTTTLSLNWPYEETDTLLQVPDSDEVLINPVFERHLRRLENWTLGQAFNQTFPKLAGTYNLKV